MCVPRSRNESEPGALNLEFDMAVSPSQPSVPRHVVRFHHALSAATEACRCAPVIGGHIEARARQALRRGAEGMMIRARVISVKRTADSVG